jgi:hypothetical protein
MATISQLFMYREDYAGAHDCLEGVRETMEPGDPGRSCRQYCVVGKQGRGSRRATALRRKACGYRVSRRYHALLCWGNQEVERD